MGMGYNKDDEWRIADDFRSIRSVFDQISTELGEELRGFDTVSMGMSHDWPLAVECGSTMVRIGSMIFRNRNYIN